MSLRTPLQLAAGKMYVREESFAGVCTCEPKVHANSWWDILYYLLVVKAH